MFYIALLFLIPLSLVALVVIVQNFQTLMTTEQLTLLVWHLPRVPILLLYFSAALLGGLLLYAVSSHSARRDAQEIKSLRKRIKELEKEKEQAKVPSGALAANFEPPAAGPMMPGFASTGPLPFRQPFSGPLSTSTPSGPLQQRPPFTNPLPNLPQPPRQLPSLPQQGGQPPFARQ